MFGQLWGVVIAGSVVMIAAVAFINHRIEQIRLDRLRRVTDTTVFLRGCWGTSSGCPTVTSPTRFERQLVASWTRERARRSKPTRTVRP